MSFKVLVAYDGSEAADVALQGLARVGLSADAVIKVVSVAEVWMPPPPSSYEVVEAAFGEHLPAASAAVGEGRTGDAYSLAYQAARKLSSEFPHWQVSAEAHAGSPAREILHAAERWVADLIVVGIQGRSGLAKVLLGSVSQRVITDAHCSVRIVRKRHDPMRGPERILIAVDGSTGAECAVDAVASRTWPERSEVRLVTVIDGGYAERRERDERLKKATVTLERAEAQVRKVGLSTTSVILEGDPRKLIVEEASTWGADCVFIGARGLGKVGKILLGSVSTAVAQRVACTIEVVRVHLAG